MEMTPKAMIRINQFKPTLAAMLPQTHALLRAANLVVHEAVGSVVLHGSRGISGCPREDSDIDLSLVVDTSAISKARNAGQLLRSALEVTQEHWQGSVPCDLAAVYDRRGCGLKCLGTQTFDPSLCQETIDCLGIYKITHGFDGFVTGPEIDCRKIYPLMVIWQREG